MAIDNDFLAFKFDGKSSQTYNLYVVSSGDRYQDNLVPDLTDLTEARVGADGTNYFGSNYTKRVKPVNVAFDNLSEVQLREMRSWLGTKKICPLIFSEAPYKQYYAKIQNPPQFKYLCFDDGEGQRVYKGEGTINFIYYYPFAKAPFKYLDDYNDENKGQWDEASKLLKNKTHPTSTITTNNYNFENFPLSGRTNYVYNMGDIATDWKLTMPRNAFYDGTSATIRSCLLYVYDGSSKPYKTLQFKRLITTGNSGTLIGQVAMTTGGSIEIDSAKQTITYIDTENELSGGINQRYCLNDLYESGEFFKIPPSSGYSQQPFYSFYLPTTAASAAAATFTCDFKFDILYY